MPSRRIEENRVAFQRYKEDVKRTGKPFYPYAMFHDTVMSLVVVSVIIGLACVWYFTSGPDPNTCGSGDSCLLGPRYAEPADPGTTNFVPRPDWYFYFLFYLLRIFKWPESVFLGTVGVPTIALMLLIGLPFLDRRRARRPSQRPVAMVAAVLTIVSMGVLTWKGATAKEALASEVKANIPRWIKDEHLPKQAIPGVNLFARAGCTACHTYDGAGGQNLGAPDLTDIANRHLGVATQIKHLQNPSSVTPGSQMPPFASLGPERLRQLALFLEASKGTH